jgi:Xaa-Pro aminopeptidase
VHEHELDLALEGAEELAHGLLLVCAEEAHPHRILDMAGDVLIYGDTVRSAALRHEVPIGIGDPFLYVETAGERHVVIGALELPRVRELDGLRVHPNEEFGYDALGQSGLSREEALEEIALRAVQALGVGSATVPPDFPLELADRLRADGVELRPELEAFQQRRRSKSDSELEGMRRAQRAAEAGMRVAAELLRSADGSLTSERLKSAIAEKFLAHGCTFDEFIVSHGPQSAIGHHGGTGEILRGEPIVIDIWPRDSESACFADMTRTFVLGEPPARLVEYHRLCKEALEQTLAATRPGVGARALHDIACEVFEAAGYPTQRTKDPAVPLEEGFMHGLGHGVGLEVHEAPSLGMLGREELVPGDVVTLEPGLYLPGWGGCRLEDLVLVTEDGAQNLTDFPYDLTP